MLRDFHGRVREWGSGVSRIEQFQALTHEYPRVIPRMGVDDGINAARHLLGICEFDAAACSEGLKALSSYRKEWDEERGTWRDKPRHDWACLATHLVLPRASLRVT